MTLASFFEDTKPRLHSCKTLARERISGRGGAGQHLVPEDLLSLEGRLTEVVRAEECNAAQCVRVSGNSARAGPE